MRENYLWWLLGGVALAALAGGGAVIYYATTTDGRRNEEKFAPVISAAERKSGLPSGLLQRLLYQESRYRSDIIEGRTVSSAGAIGIAQIVPRWHPTVDPLDPIASIYYAADYLAKLRRQFGTWSAALAAYNWGPGNLQRLGFANAPKETRDYVAQITADTGVA